MKHTIFSLALAATLALPTFASAATYEIDPVHSEVGFRVRHMMVSWVRGNFGKFSGTLEFDAKTPNKATVKADIETGSINTGNEQRDGHLKSPDFFDVAKHPKMSFKSEKFEGKDGKYKVTGELTLAGVTKEVVIDVEGFTKESRDAWGNLRIGATGKTTINRKEFGLTWNQAVETGGMVVGEDVEITLEIQAMRKAEPAAAK